MAPLAPLARNLKQCQNCLKSESSETRLSSCSGCKRAHYCSKECQKDHWKSHKKICKQNQETRALMKEEPVVSNPALAGLSKAEVESITKRWVQNYRPLLTNAAFHALELHRKPEQALTHILLITLSPTFTQEHLPRKDAEIRCAFKPTDIFVASIEELFQSSHTTVSTAAMKADLEAGFAAIAAQTNAIRAKDPAAVGYTITLIQVPDCSLVRVVPLGADLQYTELPPWDPDWQESLEICIRKGISF